MRTFAWLIVLLINLGIVSGFASLIIESEAPATVRLIGFVITVLFLAISALLIAARLRRIPSWGIVTMKMLCWGAPILWLVGSLDYGMISGLESLSVIFAAVLGGGSWWAFRLFIPKPNPAFERNA